MTASLGAMMAGGNPEAVRGRQVGDRYPTPPDVTRALIRRYEQIRIYRVWEPCAGDAAMLNVLEPASFGAFGSDIVSRAPNVTQADFLVDPPPEPFDAIITNPPFNKAPEMIERALDYRPLFVAFVLKSTFWHAARRWPLFQKHRPSAIHPLLWRPDFLGLGAPTMEVSWVVWDRMSGNRHTIYEPMEKPV